MKRLLVLILLFVVIGIFLWKPWHLSSEGLTTDASTVIGAGRKQVPPMPMADQKIKENLPSNQQTNERPAQPPTSHGIPAAQVRGIDFNSFIDSEKERIAKEYKSNFRREFDPLNDKLEITGTVALSYRRYEGKFKIQFQKPSKFNDGTRYIPIFMVGVTNPAVNMSGAAFLEDTSTDGSSIVIHLVGFALMPFFSKDVGAVDTATQEHELNEISDIMFTIESKKK